MLPLKYILYFSKYFLHPCISVSDLLYSYLRIQLCSNRFGKGELHLKIRVLPEGKYGRRFDSNIYEPVRHLHAVDEGKSGQPRPHHRETDVDRYRCQLPGLEKKYRSTLPFLRRRFPHAPDVLFMLALDASGCEMFKEYYGRQDEFNQIFKGSDSRLDGFDEFGWNTNAGASRAGSSRLFSAQISMRS